jgi:hypothetical protein
MCEKRAKDNPQNWWAVWGVEVKPAGTNKFNVLSRNDYSTLVPGYLSLRSSYSALHCMVPNPNKVLCDPVENKKYALYVAFEGKLPT